MDYIVCFLKPPDLKTMLITLRTKLRRQKASPKAENFDIHARYLVGSDVTLMRRNKQNINASVTTDNGKVATIGRANTDHTQEDSGADSER